MPASIELSIKLVVCLSVKELYDVVFEEMNRGTTDFKKVLKTAAKKRM